MELREYWQILKRRWWLPLGLALLVGLISGVQLRPWQAPPPSYAASMRLLVGVLPAAEADVTAYDPRFYAWRTSEYLVDDFTQVVASELFSQAVSQRLAQQGIQIPAGTIRGSAVTGQQHRIITLSLSWGNSEELAQIAQAAAAELEENAGRYFQALGTEGASVTLLDGPHVVPVGPGLRSRLEWPLRLILALAVGVGLVFLLEYLDTSVRRAEELEALGLEVLGAIPKQRK